LLLYFLKNTFHIKGVNGFGKCSEDMIRDLVLS